MLKAFKAFFGVITTKEEAERKLEKFLAVADINIGKLTCTKWL